MAGKEHFMSMRVVTPTDPLDTYVATALPAGEAHLGAVSGHAAIVAVTATPDAVAYSAGDNLGGKLTLAGAARVAAGSVVLSSLTIYDPNNVKPVLEVLIFDRDPTAATLTNNAAIALSTDGPNVLAHVTVASTAWVSAGTLGFATVTNLALVLKPNAGTSLYAALMTTGTPTFGTQTALVARFGFTQN